jgi:FolB domain-containing protein
MSKISIIDLEVFLCVGITDEERSQPQRLLISFELNLDFTAATISDRIEKTIDYFELSQDVLKFGAGRSWKLIEKLAANLADHVLAKYRPQSVVVEVKKFAISKARYVSVTVARGKAG